MDRSGSAAEGKRIVAVTPVPIPPKVGDYWPKYKRRAILYTLAIQVITIIIIITIGAIMMNQLMSSTVALIATVTAILAASATLNLILLNRLLAPLGDISAALTHVSGEPTIISPPHPNASHYERDGFKPLLELIYTLSSGNQEETGEKAAAHPTVDLPAVLTDLPVGFIALNSERKVIYANKAAPVHADNSGATVIDLLFDGDITLDKWLADCSAHAVHAERFWQRVPNKIPGEEERKIYDISASYQKGSEAEVVLVLFDRSGSYQPEDDSLDFIAFAAHELRGPITVIRGYLDVLGDELGSSLQPDQVELMSRLIVSANRLSSYINNILNASRYDRRHLKIRLKEDSLANIYQAINDDMQLRASSQHRLLSVNLPPDLPTVAADAASIGEVMGNLIDNAIKYSNEGGAVNVTADVTDDFVTVSVEDHGIGMPGQVVGNLFHKFYRSHRSRETVAGTGIGLYICKAIVESHGGTIGVKSVEGQGSTFSFSLPIYATVAEKLKANDNSNEGIIEHGEGWIKNHAMFRG